MRFLTRKKRQAPAVIIISLIDILIVLLIFLMVTTTFKQFPAVKLSLPEVRTPKEGATQNNQTMIVTVAKQEPHYYLNTVPVTLTKLQEEFTKRGGAQGTNAALAIRSDKEATFDTVIKVVQAAYAANLKPQISVFVQQPGGTTK
ncbi:MAG TPA: biopolymer transporter ExbD [Verrucomicrobiae bacterium]